MPKSPEEMIVSMIKNLEENTGRSLEAWVTLARASKLAKHGQIVAHLKSDHGLTHGYANLVALKALQADDAPAPGGDELVAAQYGGAKAALRPIYDALLAKVTRFGGDVEIAPKKAYVSLRRGKQFGIIQPTTATRLDVGINLKGTPATSRLESSGSFNAMVSHRVRVGAPGDVDAELVGWLKQAYEKA